MRLTILLVLTVTIAACTAREAPVTSETSEDSGVAEAEEREDQPPRLGERDWIVARVFPGSDSSLVRSELGAPQEFQVQQGPYGEELVAWKYGGLTVHFNEPQVSAVTLTGPRSRRTGASPSGTDSRR